MAGAKTYPSDDAVGINQWGLANLPQPPSGSKAAVRKFTGSGYTQWNKALKDTPPKDIPAKWKADTLKLDKATEQQIGVDMYVFRGTALDQFNVTSYEQLQQKVGHTLQQNAYQSTSVGQTPAFYHNPVHIAFRVPPEAKGVWAANDSSIGIGERELILARQTRYFIHKVSKSPDGKILVEAEIIPEGQPDPVSLPSPIPPPPGKVGKLFSKLPPSTVHGTMEA